MAETIEKAKLNITVYGSETEGTPETLLLKPVGITELQYRLGDGEWITLFPDRLQTLQLTEKTTCTIRSVDAFGEETIRSIKWYDGTAEMDLVDLAGGEFTISGVKRVTNLAGTTVTVGDKEFACFYQLAMSDSVIDATGCNPTYVVQRLSCSGSYNRIDGVICLDSTTSRSGSELVVDAGTKLEIGESMYNYVFGGTLTSFENVQVKGELVVTGFDEIDDLTIAMLDGSVYTKTELAGVYFKGAERNCICTGKISESTTQLVSCDFVNGTTKSDAVTINKGVKVNYGIYGVLDTGLGTDSFTLKSGASLSANDVVNINRITLEKSKDATVTQAKFNNVTFDLTKAGTLTLQDATSFTAASLTADAAKCAKITLGKASSVQISGKVSSVSSIKIGDLAGFEAGSMLGSAKSTSITLGKVASAEIGELLTLDGADKITVGETAEWKSGNLNLGIGSNKISLAKNAVWNSGNIETDAGSDKIEMKEKASFTAGEVKLGAGNDSVKVAKGAKWTSDALITNAGNDSITLEDTAEFCGGSVQLDSGSDTIKIGKEAKFFADLLFMGTGNDKLTIGDLAEVNVSGLAVFGTGTDKDQITVGKGAIVTLKSADAATVSKLTLADGAQAYLSRELCGMVSKMSNSAAWFDIGTAEIALNFTDIEQEQADDTFFESKVKLGSDTVDGWLCGSDDLDMTDFYAINGHSAISWTNSDGSLLLRQYDAKGNELKDASTSAAGIVTFADGAEKFSIGLAENHADHEAIAYTLTTIA